LNIYGANRGKPKPASERVAAAALAAEAA